MTTCADWPENPSEGDTHTLGNTTYTWDGEKWEGNAEEFTYDREVYWSSVASTEDPGTPTSDPDNWLASGDATSVWRAERERKIGLWGPWTVTLIRGADGEDGTGADGTSSNLPYTSFVFIRSTETPDTPTGGDWNDPIPDGWSDGIPAGTLQVWMSQRIFTTDGLDPQDDAWSTPTTLTDTGYITYMFSEQVTDPGTPDTNPEYWLDDSTVSSIWMATQLITNGVAGDWQVVKIRGEDGSGATRGFNFFRVGTTAGTWSDTTANNAVPDATPIVNDVVTIYKLTDTSVSTTKFWNGVAWESPADGGLFFGSIIVDGSVISRHLAASISLTTPRINSGTINGSLLQLLNGGQLTVMTPQTFGPDELVLWIGDATGNYTGTFGLDDFTPTYANLEKSNAKVWMDSDGNIGLSGTIYATGGTFDNVTINDTCTILGTLSIQNITGVITKSQVVAAPTLATGITSTWTTIFTKDIAANADGIDSTVSLSELLIEAYASKSSTSSTSPTVEIQILIDSNVVKSFTMPMPSSDVDDGSGTYHFLNSMFVSASAEIGSDASNITVQARFDSTTALVGTSSVTVNAQNVLVQLIPTSSEAI